MRAPPFPPAEMPPDVRRLHDDMAPEIAAHLKGFVSMRDDGALVGPFAPMLRFPQFGGPAWAYTKALIENAKLPQPAHEAAILATGAASTRATSSTRTSAWPMRRGSRPPRSAGQRPADLTDEEAAAYDVAAVLAAGKQLPESTNRRAVDLFGEEQTAELIYLVAGYCSSPCC